MNNGRWTLPDSRQPDILRFRTAVVVKWLNVGICAQLRTSIIESSMTLGCRNTEGQSFQRFMAERGRERDESVET